jgi:hypothetical protein
VRVRYRRPGRENTRWRYGLLINPRCLYDENVKAAAIRDDRTGGLMTILREHVQVSKKGPRGGTKWSQL